MERPNSVKRRRRKSNPISTEPNDTADVVRVRSTIGFNFFPKAIKLSIEKMISLDKYGKMLFRPPVGATSKLMSLEM
jgi:hypothetical protein